MRLCDAIGLPIHDTYVQQRFSIQEDDWGEGLPGEGLLKMSNYFRSLKGNTMNSNRSLAQPPGRGIATMLEEFQRYQPYDDLEAQHQRQLVDLIQTAVDPLDADCFVPGHGTGSVWIFDPRTRQVAMIFHNKLKRWLQPGGHAELDGVCKVVCVKR
jgi:hypothetical protein